jgi:hypothetical protein
MLFFITKPSQMLSVSLFRFQPSEHNTYADIEAAYKCLIENFGAKEEEIILYGQSVGSGPTVDLASRLARLRAVVLHSPILSGLRVMYPVKRTYWFDIYKVIICYSPLSILSHLSCALMCLYYFYLMLTVLYYSFASRILIKSLKLPVLCSLYM